MCHYRLGDAAKAREYYERAKDSHERNTARHQLQSPEEMQQFRREAETLLGKPAEN